MVEVPMSVRELVTAALSDQTVSATEEGPGSPSFWRIDRLGLALFTLSVVTLVVRRAAHSVWHRGQQAADERDLERFVACNYHIADDIGLTIERRLPHSLSQ
jgi:hypothetical protein